MNFQQIQNKLSILRNKKVALAVSGGVDSMVLFHLFNSIKLKFNINLFVLHYNHKWRKESKKDSKLVKNLCIRNKVQYIYSETKGKVIKSEEIARKQRYDFFKECTLKNKFDFICTAHHKDDQIETIIFRLIRGTGPNGLLPIKEISNLTSDTVIYRPFLDLARENIKRYAKKYKVSFNEDTTNLNIKFSRNFIRLNIIPIMKKINKNYMDNILLFCNLSYRQNSELGNYFNKAYLELRDNKNNDIYPIIFNKEKLVSYGYNFLVPFLYWFLTKIGIKGNLKKIYSVIDAINNCKKIDLDKTIILDASKKQIMFQLKTNSKKRDYLKKSLKFKINSKLNNIAFNNKNILIITPFLNKKLINKFPLDIENKAFVDLSGFIGKNLTIRYRKPHDVFQPLGSTNILKLKKFLINKKIQVEKRYELPLLCTNSEVLWVPGYAISERLRVKTIPTHKLELKTNYG